MRPLQASFWRDQVVVITGASAGVGRACALLLAREGARLCLIARPSAGLEHVRNEAARLGASVIAHAADVADAAAVRRAALACIQAFGRIDVWINNAMATVYGRVSELQAEEIRRVTEVTYLGAVHGTLAALRHMQACGRGTIVQVGSGLAYRAVPLQAAYSAAKHALRGFHEALRAELIESGSKIRVSMVHLPAIDTPQFDWARTHQATQPRPIAPIYTPEAAARAILQAARRPRREYWVGGITPMLVMAQRLAPGALERYVAHTAARGQDSGVPIRPGRADNLFESAHTGHHTRGTWSREARQHALVVPGSLAAGTTLLLLGAGALATGVLLSRLLRR